MGILLVRDFQERWPDLSRRMRWGLGLILGLSLFYWSWCWGWWGSENVFLVWLFEGLSSQ